MSYDIYFIKRKDLTLNNIEAILESDALTTDNHFIRKQLMIKIKDKLVKQGLKFEVFEESNEGYLELNFPTYQVSMYNNQFEISVPYWNSNSNDGINNEIKIIINTFLEEGFTGYDQQTGEFIVSKYEFKRTFSESKSTIDKTQNKLPNNNLNYIFIGIAILIVGIVIWKLLKN